MPKTFTIGILYRVCFYEYVTMNKILFGLVLVSVPMLSGCTVPSFGGRSLPAVSFARSTDGGDSFESVSTIDTKTNFASASVVSLAIDPKDTRHIVLGTKESGLFETSTAGDTWKKITYPPTRIYGLVMDTSNATRWFATGEWQGRGKIYRTQNAGEQWDEVYTEPANGTVITSLAQNPFAPDVFYAATSKGMVIRTNNGGETWQNVTFTAPMSGRVIWKIAFDTHRDHTLYFLVDGKGLFVTDEEKIVTEPTKSMSFTVASSSVRVPGSSLTGVAASLAIDPSVAGTVLVGSSQGLFRSRDFGQTWEGLNVIESSKQTPIQAVAINPLNNREIVYISALTLYKSTDDGVHWLTRPLASDKSASFIAYDPYESQKIYIGFKE